MNKDSVGQFPSARKDQLIVKEVDGEVLVYDLRCNKAHCLNSTAALVWRYCDGSHTVGDIAGSLGKATGTSVDDRVVWLALDVLEKFSLLDAAPVKPDQLAGMNRRQLIRNVGFAALAMPVIFSVAAPSAQAQASLLPPGACCNGGSECYSGHCDQQSSCSTTGPSTKACR